MMTSRVTTRSPDGSASQSNAQRPAATASGTPILVVGFVGFCLTLLVYAPGYMSWDSLDQLQQARTGVLADNHPPLVAAIWSVMDRVSAGPFGMLMLQVLLFWGGLAVFFIHTRGPVLLRAACVLLVGFFPPVFGLVGTIWKDLFMLGVLLLAVGLIARSSVKKGILSSLIVFCLLVLGSATRHNAIVVIPPILFWYAHSFGVVRSAPRKAMFVRAGAAAVVCSLLVYVAASMLSKRLTDRTTHLWQALAVFDMTGISVNANEVQFPDEFSLLRRPASLEDLKKVYTSGSVARLYRPWKNVSGGNENRFHTTADEHELDELSRLWRASILKHPVAYVAHRWGVFSHVVGLTRDPVDTPIYGLYGPRIAENDLGFVFHASQLNEAITARLIRLSKTPLYRVWVYLIVLLALLVIGTRAYRRSGSVAVLALSLSGLLYVLPLFLVAASSNFRYSLWGLVMAVLGTCTACCEASARNRPNHSKTFEGTCTTDCMPSARAPDPADASDTTDTSGRTDVSDRADTSNTSRGQVVISGKTR